MPLDTAALVERLVTTLDAPNAARLAAAVTDLVLAHEIPSGLRLPPIRVLASALGMSPSAVGQAWHALREKGVIETRTRGGTVVLGPPSPVHPRRFAHLTSRADAAQIDLGRPRPDTALLPDLRAALSHLVDQAGEMNAAEPPPVTASLRDAAAEGWPFRAARFLAVHRGIDGVEQALSALVSADDVIAVEDPTVPRILDVADRIGARVAPITWRADGPDLRELARAARAGARLFVFQPNGQSPTGASVDDVWLERAAALLARADMRVLELDAFPFLHDIPRSLGRLVPDATLTVRGFNLSHGPDVQAAVLAGADELVERVQLHVSYAHRWVSRVLQDTLASMLADRDTITLVSRAAGEYRRRHSWAAEWFSARGLAPSAGVSAPSLWLPVVDDAAVVAELARRGIGVASGAHFRRRRTERDHIHVNGIADPARHEAHFAVIADVADAVGEEARARRREHLRTP